MNETASIQEAFGMLFEDLWHRRAALEMLSLIFEAVLQTHEDRFMLIVVQSGKALEAVASALDRLDAIGRDYQLGTDQQRRAAMAGIRVRSASGAGCERLKSPVCVG